MIQSWFNSRSLLVLCGICYALFAVIILFLGSPDWALTLGINWHSRVTIELIGVLPLAAGVCCIAAGIWNSKEANSWLLLLNGLACSALGTMVILGATRPVKFRNIALLIVAMAVSIGFYEFVTARKLRGHRVEEWLMFVAAMGSAAFAVVFVGFVLGWIRLQPSPSAQTFNWLGAYFAFSAICMLGMALGRLQPPEPVHSLGNHALPIS